MNHPSTSPSRAGRCPDKCAGGADRQRQLTAGELGHVSIKARREISASCGLGCICGYCGCVYIREGSFTRRLGVLMGGWHSALFPRESTTAKSLDSRGDDRC